MAIGTTHPTLPHESFDSCNLRLKILVSKARQNFLKSDDCTFNYENFSYQVVRLFFDLLHPETDKEVSLSDALELMLFCNHEGQIDQKSDFETRLYEELSQQILEKMKDSRERCFIWMYLRTDPNHSGMVWNIFSEKTTVFRLYHTVSYSSKLNTPASW